MKDTEASTEAASDVAQPKISFIKLESDWGGRLAGTVLRADADLIGMLEVEGVKYRLATNIERGLAGLLIVSITGEAGPEVILPLTRGRDGKLGVDI